MKKLLFVLLVVFGFVACSQHATQSDVSETTVVDTVATFTCHRHVNT